MKYGHIELPRPFGFPTQWHREGNTESEEETHFDFGLWLAEFCWVLEPILVAHLDLAMFSTFMDNITGNDMPVVVGRVVLEAREDAATQVVVPGVFRL
jgi:hypothetical protein